MSVAANPLSLPASEIKNGTVSFSVTTLPPTSPIPGAPDCPNPNWTEAITDLQFTSATIIVEQPPPTIVLTVSCTFAPPTINGPVTKQTVTCGANNAVAGVTASPISTAATLTLTPADIAHITQVTNTRGSAFSQFSIGPDPYSFVSTAVLGGNQLQICVLRQRTGSTFCNKESSGGVLTDTLINQILTGIERQLQLKPAQ